MKNYYHVGHMISAVSDEEMERRWLKIQEGLKAADIDCLLLYGMEARQGAPVKYTLNWSCEDGQGYTIIIPKEGKGAVFGHGYYGTPTIPPECVKQIGFNVAAPMAPVLGYTDMYIPRLIMEYLDKIKPVRRIGIYRRNILPWHFVKHVKECIPDVELVDCDEIYDAVKAVKSGEELEALKDASRMLGEVFDAANVFLRPGRLEHEVNVDFRKMLLDVDCESLNIFITSGKKPEDIEYEYPLQWQTRRIEEGDVVKVLFKCAMRGGYFATIGRMFFVGEAEDEYKKAVDDAFRLQDEIAGMLRPGVMPADICKAADEFRRKNGYMVEDTQLLGYQQGTEMVERPAFMSEETMPLGDHMVFAVNASVKSDRAYACCCDNYLLEDGKAERITSAERRLFMI